MLRRLTARVRRGLDRLWWELRRRYGRVGPLQLLVYRGFGTPERVSLLGRVVEGGPAGRPSVHDGAWRNLARTVRRFIAHEVPGAVVRARLGSALYEAQTDEEGYFALELAPARHTPGRGGWLPLEVELAGCPVPGWRGVRARADVLVLERAQLGIISDIDDTILQTHVSRRLKMIWVTLAGNELTRLPFEGTSELYRALASGPSGQAQNPVFYVSKSPWNLYDFLIEFMERHQLPRGPLLLREAGLYNEAPLDFKGHALRHLFELYRELPFVLVGDNGERDPEVYLEVAALHPGRVRAIYIRDVGSDRRRARQLSAMVEEARRIGSEMLLVSHARQALAHARQLGLAAR
jgi:phosphatidate phosphatase APP1